MSLKSKSTDCFTSCCLVLPLQSRLQNHSHRIAGIGRDLWGSSSPTPLPKQGHLQQAAQDLVQAGFEYLQRRGLYNPSGQPLLVLHHPQSKEVLPHVQMELPMLQFVPVAPHLVTGHHRKVWPHPSKHPALLYLQAFIRSPLIYYINQDDKKEQK